MVMVSPGLVRASLPAVGLDTAGEIRQTAEGIKLAECVGESRHGPVQTTVRPAGTVG